MAGLDLLFVKQLWTRAPTKLPTRKEATDEGIVDAATMPPVLRPRGSDVGPEEHVDVPRLDVNMSLEPSGTTPGPHLHYSYHALNL